MFHRRLTILEENLELTYTCQLLHEILESNLKVVTKVSPKEFQYVIQLWNMQNVTWKPLIKMHSTHIKIFQQQSNEIWL